jgi:hypothetical protein
MFLVDLPAYAEKIWDPENADYLHLMPLKKIRKSDRELEAEEDDDSEDDDSDTGDLTEEQHVEDPWKDVKKYTFDMRDLGQLMKINLKLSVKKVYKKGPKPNKSDYLVWDALPWDGQENSCMTSPSIRVFHVCGRIYFSGKTRPYFRSRWSQ